MYSIASWSPSQSEPLIVSYMCQSQLSSDMLPSDAPIPPCAATVCERVGNTFDSTATLNPASASCSDARMPAPPAPMISASNRRVGSFIGNLAALAVRRRSWPAPQHLDRPAAVGDQQADDGDLQREPQTHRLRVVHQDIAHADPRVPQQGDHQHERCDPERVAREQRLPRRVIEATMPEHDTEEQHRIDDHHDRRHALRQPVAQAVVRAYWRYLRAAHHSRTAMATASTTDSTSRT